MLLSAKLPIGCAAALLLGCLGGCGASGVAQESEVETTSPRPANSAPAAEALANGTPPAAASPSADWPGWRGPGGRSAASGDLLADPWPRRDPQPIWKRSLGTGWSSPVAVDDRVFITDRQDEVERLIALSAENGEVLWTVTNAVDFDPHAVGRRHGNGPKSTPAASRQRVYSLGIAGWLQAVDIKDGNVAWSIHLPERFGRHVPLPGGKAFVEGTEHVIVPIGQGEGAPVPLFGYTGSLLLTDGLLILSVGGQRGGTIMALDASNGRVVWSALDEHVSYSSPVLAEFNGVRQVVAMTGPRVVGLRLDDGRLLWSHPFQIQYDESISTPAVSDRLVLVTGDSRPLTALEPPAGDPGSAQPARVAWENWDLSSYLSSMVVSEGHVYGMSDDGSFACVRLSDGKTVWTGGNHGMYCSPVLVGKRLLGLNEDGELAVLAATPDGYRPLGSNQLSQAQSWTMPAVAGGRLYIRDQQSIMAFDFSR